MLPHAAFVMFSGTNTACWRSRALVTPLRQPSAMDWDIESGKISSSPFSTPSKMATATDSGEVLREIDASGHIGIDRSGQNGMNRHALPGQERPQRLSHAERGGLRNGITGWQRTRESHQGSEQVDRQMLFDHLGLAQIVVHGDTGVVDEDVEAVSVRDGPLNLHSVSHVEG